MGSRTSYHLALILCILIHLDYNIAAIGLAGGAEGLVEAVEAVGGTHCYGYHCHG